MLDRPKTQVIATHGLALEQFAAVNRLAATRRATVRLSPALIGHKPKEVSAHEVVIQVRLVPVRPSFNELVRKRVNQQTADRHVPMVLPLPHHATQGYEIVVAQDVPVPDRGDLRSRVRRSPGTSTISVGESERAVCVREDGNHFEGHIPEVNLDNLAISANACLRIGLFNRGLDRLQQRRLPISDVVIVSAVHGPRQLEDHVDVAKTADRGVSAI